MAVSVEPASVGIPVIVTVSLTPFLVPFELVPLETVSPFGLVILNTLPVLSSGSGLAEENEDEKLVAAGILSYRIRE